MPDPAAPAPTPPADRARSPSADRRRRSRRRGMHLWDYVGVVRNHWFLSFLVAALLFGGVVAKALLATPVYEATARLQIDLGRSSQDEFLSDLLIFGGSTYTGTEMEMMRSYTVARKAAEDEVALPVAIVEEENAYRPFDVLLRRWKAPGWQPCVLAVDPAHCPRPKHSTQWRIEVGPKERRLIIYDHPEGKGRRLVVEDPVLGTPGGQAGTPIDIWGHRLALTVVEGSPAGRTFLLSLRPEEAAARWIHRSTRVEEVGDWTGVVDLSFRASSPQVAARIADAVARAYTELKAVLKRERLDGTVGWLQEQVARTRLELERAYEARDEYVSAHGAALLTTQAQSIYDKQGELIREKFDLEQRLRDVEAQLAAFAGDRRTDEYLVAIGASKVDARTSALVSQRTDLEIQRAVLLEGGNATPQSPEVVAVDAQMAVVTEQLDAAVKALVVERTMVLQRERAGIQAGLARVADEEARQQALLDKIPGTERRLIELGRPIQTNEAFYASLITSLKEAEMSRASALSGVRIIDPAFAPTGRKSPSLTRALVLAILLSLVGGLGTAFLLEYLNRTVKTPQELEEGLGLSIYGAIPKFSSVRRRERGKRRSPMVALTNPASVLAEAYRTLRANIRFAETDRPVQSLAITSSVQQEGKTVTTLNLAVVLARAGAKVIVVDADMRRPTTHVHLGGAREPGLVDVLRDGTAWQDAVHGTEVENLDLLPAGRTPDNPGALLDSERFTALLAALKEGYEYVLFDVPPVLAVADAASFFRQLDAILLLVRARRYNIEVAEGAQEQIERLGGRLLGVVFNGFDARRSARHGYGYYGYYGYYSRYAERGR